MEISIRKKIDIYITLLIAYFFIVCISFKVLNLDNSMENYFMLELVMIIALIGYYSNVTLSLIISLIIDFSYMSFKLYLNFANNTSIDGSVYYWVILIPVTMFFISILSKNIVSLQKENEVLKNENSKLVMIDKNTNIRNERALLIELPVYMRLSKRHDIPVTLFIVRIKFADKLINLLGRKQYDSLLIQASEVFQNSLREEDMKYLIDYKTFAFLTITNKEGVNVVKERIKANIDNYEFTKRSLYKNVKLDIQIGSYTADNSLENPLEFIKFAEKELEYDIHE